MAGTTFPSQRGKTSICEIECRSALIAIDIGFRRMAAPNNDPEMDQLRVSFEFATHHLMPMLLEGLSRHEGLAHLDEGILKIDMGLIDSQHHDIVPIVPNVLELADRLPLAQPDLS